MSGNLGEIQENIGLDIQKKGRSCPKNLHGHYSGKPTSVEATKPSPERFFERFCEWAKKIKKILQKPLTPIHSSLSGRVVLRGGGGGCMGNSCCEGGGS